MRELAVHFDFLYLVFFSVSLLETVFYPKKNLSISSGLKILKFPYPKSIHNPEKLDLKKMGNNKYTAVRYECQAVAGTHDNVDK